MSDKPQAAKDEQATIAYLQQELTYAKNDQRRLQDELVQVDRQQMALREWLRYALHTEEQQFVQAVKDGDNAKAATHTCYRNGYAAVLDRIEAMERARLRGETE
jgi:predicted  nucleic acid-binding Zn-ribbon protein